MEIRRRASVVCVYNNQLLTVMLKDPATGVTRHFLPGGQIEEHEQAWETAARETLEETGYQVEVDRSSEISKHYLFKWAGKTVPCETFFYRARLRSEEALPVADVAYNLGSKWLPLPDVHACLGYHQEIYQVISALLANQK